MFPEDKNRIENLKKTLYSRENFKPDNPIHNLSPQQNDVNGAWRAPIVPIQKTKKSWPLIKILVWFSIIFFLIAVGIAGYVFYSGSNTVSADNVNVTINGPTTVDAGRLATIQIGIDNKNQLDLQDAYLDVEYPDGSRRSSGDTDPLTSDRIPLGTVASGAHIDKTISAVFFGLQNTAENIKISVEYHVLGSSSIFAKSKDYTFSLGAGPVSMTVTHATQVNSGQDISFSIVTTSNSATTLSGLSLNVLYPFGFTFKSAIPSASRSNSVWQIGDLAPGASKTITIVGRLEGQENEQRAFKFNVGLANPADMSQIATIFYGDTENVSIQKPFIGLGMTFNGDNASSTYAANAGDTTNIVLSYSNNMSVPIVDATINLTINGAILDKSSVSPVVGFYQSASNIITWDKRTIPELGLLNPGDSGTVQFAFKTLPFSAGALYTKSSQKVTLAANVTATQVNAGGTTAIASSLNRSVLVNSNISLASSAMYNSGPFKNTGPIPPKAEKETTYTITWAVTNTFNNASNVTVSAVLPSYVKFLNNFNPQNEPLTYNPVSGEVDWNVGNIKTNTGFGTTPRQVSFQVSILPSLTQAGSAPILVGQSTLKANDAFTGTLLTSATDQLTTEITTDPQYRSGIGTVTP